MAGGKETPRQKMIGMMYLVLTALLAMNVSKEVINAFVTIDDGQIKTLTAVDAKLATQYSALEKNATESEEKYGPARDNANKVKTAADDLILHIDKIKAKTFAISINGPDALVEDVYDISSRRFSIGLDSIKSLVGVDNYDNNTRLMVGEPDNPNVEDDVDGNNYSAAVLRDKLIAYRELVVQELGKIKGTAALVDNMEKTFTFPTKEEARAIAGPGKDAEGWVVKNFYHVPLAASTAILTTLQSNIRSAQSDVVDQLYKEVEGESFKFNRLKSAVIPQATTITQGASYSANVFLAAYDDQNQPEIRLGAPGVKWDSIKEDLTGESVKLDIDPITNMGIVDLPSGGLGTQQRDGMIIFRPVGGQEIKTGFTLDYQVVAPTLVVSPTKMNVFYKGIPNPVNVSIPGFTADQIAPSISNGSISKGSDGYIVNVSSGNSANVNCSATLPDGSKKSYGPVEFRVKRIPDPVPSFATKKPTDNTVKKSDMNLSQGLRAEMENFDFDVNVSVKSFDMIFVRDGQVISKSSSSNRVTSEMQANMKKVRQGEKIYFENIQVRMPDGTTRKVANIILKVV